MRANSLARYLDTMTLDTSNPFPLLAGYGVN